MPQIKKYILCLLLIISSLDAVLAQDKNYGKWLVYFGNQKINNKWLLQSDLQYRLNQIPNQKSQLLLRAGIGYNLTESNNNILLGLAYVQTNWEEGDETRSATYEKRVYQQYLFKQKLNNLLITHRARMEERFIADDFGLRSRYFISLQKPLNGKLLNRRSVYASCFNELFLDIKNQKFDRNRLYAGIGYGVTNDIRLETGYLIQAQKNSTRGQFQLIVYNNLSF
ncbi:MAG: DUF2490 domain-containing protein [Bacteroidetes bacterium]|nr:DUF2490 domain-containing protein [Bacteroidota bacterium]